MKKQSIAKYFVLGLILSLISFNAYNSIKKKDDLTILKSKVSSISRSKSYFALLNLWYSFARNQDWDNTQKLEVNIASADLLSYKRQYDPIFLQRRAQVISQKKDQTVEDWVELSKIFTVLNQPQNAKDALREARLLDPLRSDLEKIEFEISNN